MGREKKCGFLATASAKDRHKRERRAELIDWKAPLPPGLRARRAVPRLNSKHKTMIEFVENKKRPTLEFQTTEDREPPPGFDFIPVGNPNLTRVCKELSRERRAMVFIVTSSVGGQHTTDLSLQLNRIGYHVRQSIVQQACEQLGIDSTFNVADIGKPEPIPERQEDINAQADAAIRDLFPRIPNPDRQTIVEHAFNKAHKESGGGGTVGLAEQLPLSRRVQLAVLAHIRHQHTNYDAILKEYGWATARKAAYPICLEHLVKWRGDEENGRDTAEEILRELVIISDSDSDSDSEEDDDGDDDTEDEDVDAVSSDSSAQSSLTTDRGGIQRPGIQPPSAVDNDHSLVNGIEVARHATQTVRRLSHHRHTSGNKVTKNDFRKARRGFSRYEAVRAAVEQNQLERRTPLFSSVPMAVDRWTGREPLTLRPVGPEHVLGQARAPVESSSLGLIRPEDAKPQQTCYRDGQRDNVNTHPYHMAESENYHYGKEIRDSLSDRYWPIVRSPPAVNARNERGVYHGQDLQDLPIQSIEPLSPDRARFRDQMHARKYLPEPALIDQTVAEGRYGPPRYAQRVLDHDPPFRSQPSLRDEYQQVGRSRREEPRLSVTSGLYHELHTTMAPGPRDVDRDYLRTDPPYGHGRQFPPPDYGSAMSHDRHFLRPEYNPIWVKDDEATLRSRARPILIQDAGESLDRVLVSAPSQDYGIPHIPISASEGMNGHQVGPGDRDYHIGNFADVSSARYSGFAGYSSAEIVHVSNKFPRRHEPPPILDQPEHHDTGWCHRVERVVGRVTGSVYGPEPRIPALSRENRTAEYNVPSSGYAPEDQRHAGLAACEKDFHYVRRPVAPVALEPVPRNEYRRSTVYLDY